MLKATPNTAGVARCLYTATNGSLYYVCGQSVYFIDSTWTMHLLGMLAVNAATPVAMQDNGNVILLADGTSSGYAINLQTGIVGRPLAGQVTDAGSTTSGQPGAVAITNAGHSGTNGLYASAALTGGSGTGATAAIWSAIQSLMATPRAQLAAGLHRSIQAMLLHTGLTSGRSLP